MTSEPGNPRLVRFLCPQCGYDWLIIDECGLTEDDRTCPQCDSIGIERAAMGMACWGGEEEG